MTSLRSSLGAEPEGRGKRNPEGLGVGGGERLWLKGVLIKVGKGESEGGRVTFPKLHEHSRRVSVGKGREGGGP